MNDGTQNNKPRTAQVGAISKAQKQQEDFKVSSILFYSTGMRNIEKKFPKFFFVFFFDFLKSPICRIVPKNVRGVLLDFLNIHFFAK